MEKITLVSIISILTISIGAILIAGGNIIGDYMVVTGSVIGLYSMHLIDVEDAKKPEK